MKTVMKKLLSLMLVAVLLVSVAPTAFAADGDPCRITLSPYSGTQDLSANKVTVTLEEGSTITAALVESLANQAWASLGYTYKSCLLGVDGTIAMPGTTIPVEVTIADNNNDNNDNNDAATGDLIVYAMTKTEATGYVDFNYGQPIVIEGGADKTLDKALAETVIGKQLLDFKWQGATEDAEGNVTVNLLATILETSNGKAVYQLRVQHNDGTSNYTQIDIYEGEGILAAIKNAGITPSYADHVLVGYTLNHTGNANYSVNIYHVAEASMANENGVIKVYADWREKTDDDDEDFEYGEGGGLNGDANTNPIYDVVLMVYTNDNVKSYAKKITASEMGAYTKDGVLTRDEVQLIIQKNFKITNNSKFYGLFTAKTWDNGDYDVDYAVSSLELDPDTTNTVYVMVKNATVIKADPSNPQTGDGIALALAAMMSTGGAALVLGKKKFF